MLYSKLILGLLIIGIAIPTGAGIVNFKAPYVKNFQVNFVGWHNDVMVFSGSVDIQYKNPQAWSDLGYKDGNFQYFYAYWQGLAQAHKTFTYAGVSVNLMSITMNLVEHTQSHDHIEFTIELQLA